MKPEPHIIIAGGKTGGHLFPGIAVAQALRELSPETKILFVGTRAPFEEDTLARYGFEHRAILSRPIKGKNPLSKAYSAALVLISLIQALWIVFRFRADFVLGVGGFSSFALVLAARILGRRTAIQEQNARPGMTNRLLARISHTIFLAFERTAGMPLNAKTFWVGNPIRKTPENQRDTGGETAFLATLAKDDFLVLATGGSQGAASINKAFSGAVKMLAGEKHMVFVHQTGTASEAEIKRFYEENKLKVDARAFFHDMPAIQKRADLVVARAGAGTLSELAAMGKACILIPFPYAADDHQTANAKNFSDRGASILIPDRELEAETLCDIIRNLAAHPETLGEMEVAMRQLAMPDAARTIAAHILGTVPQMPGNALKGDQ